ncbi:MAG: hypothetical protein DME96_01325 [Verrucomicrobia bacterium]|nr:MAG: hypothetical protein DME96_01325 [Verrucomicrobiota bacterium]
MLRWPHRHNPRALLCDWFALDRFAVNSEKKSDLPSATPKIDMICAPRTTSLTPPFVSFAYPRISFAFSASVRAPLVPPPRTFLS